MTALGAKTNANESMSEAFILGREKAKPGTQGGGKKELSPSCTPVALCVPKLPLPLHFGTPARQAKTWPTCFFIS